VDDLGAQSRVEDELLAQGYALFFAGMLDEPLLEFRLAMRTSSDDPARGASPTQQPIGTP
jgi:hypothetical protein